MVYTVEVVYEVGVGVPLKLMLTVEDPEALYFELDVTTVEVLLYGGSV